MLELSKVMGEAGGNIKPAIDQLERIKGIFWNNSEKVDQLPKPERPKQISKEENSGYDTSSGLDNENPF